MADPKQEILDMLRDLAELTLLDEGDPQSFRVRAYESAADSIRGAAVDFASLTPKQLQGIRGIGKSTAQKIAELRETGRVEKLEALRRKYPASTVALLRIPGLGPKAVLKLKNEVGVTSVDELRAALAGQRLRNVAGFGARTEEKLLHTLARLDEQGATGRTPIAVALPHANRMVDRLRDVPGVVRVEYCGSLRRFSETVGDIDIVVAALHAGPVMDAVVSMGQVDQVLARGESKTSVVTHRGVQVDVRVVAPHQLGAALLYFTGSKGHNVKLRQRALARGLTLNEYALSELASGRVVASETEDEIYAALGLSYIPPHLREDQGELEAAEQGTLPSPIGHVYGDFHVHTDVSGDAKSSLEQIVAAARSRGYHAIAITDHAEGAAAGVGRDALLDQREKIRALQAELGGAIRVLHGVELNIGPRGELDYDAEFRAGFDFCLASIHSHFELDREAQTRRVLAAMEEPSVRMIGHLSARNIGSRPGVELDLAAVLDGAERTGTALEVNGGLSRLDVSAEGLRQARGRDVRLVLTSDAHHEGELERVRYAATHTERAWVEPAQVVNTWPAERLLAWCESRA